MLEIYFAGIGAGGLLFQSLMPSPQFPYCFENHQKPKHSIFGKWGLTPPPPPHTHTCLHTHRYIKLVGLPWQASLSFVLSGTCTARSAFQTWESSYTWHLLPQTARFAAQISAEACLITMRPLSLCYLITISICFQGLSVAAWGGGGRYLGGLRLRRARG